MKPVRHLVARAALVLAAGVLGSSALAVPAQADTAPAARGDSASVTQSETRVMGQLEKMANSKVAGTEATNRALAENPKLRKGVVKKYTDVKDVNKLSVRQYEAEHGTKVTPASTCRQASYTVYGENITGAKTWRYNVAVDWCWDGKVTSISPPQSTGYVYDWAAALGWSYEGRRDFNQWDYYGDKWVYRTYSQGAFDYCPPRIICIQHKYPKITIDTYGDGRADYSWSEG